MKHNVIIVSLIAILCSVFILFGFISPDSVNYLIMSTTTDDSGLCQAYGGLYGVYACGYPALIKLTSLIFLNMSSFLSSKILNCIILCVSFFIFRYTFSNVTLAIILTLLPFNIFIASYTWSENAILLSFVLYVLAIYKAKSDKNIGWAVQCLSFAAIFIGVFSRFAFAPFSVLIFMSTFFVLKEKALKLLPSFVLNALIFILYKYALSAYDMERIYSPESLWYLFLHFGYNSLIEMPTYVILAISFATIFKIKIKSFQLNDWALFFIMCGLGYMLLSFLMRAVVQYDMYDSRTIGFGFYLLFGGGIISCIEQIKTKSLHVLTVLALLLLSYPIYHSEIIGKFKASIEKKEFFNYKKIDKYILSKKKPEKSVIIHITKKGFDDVIYGTSIKNLQYQNPESEIIPLLAPPYYRVYNVDDYIDFIHNRECKIVFSNKLTESYLIDFLNSQYKVGVNTKIDLFSEEVKSIVLNKFKGKDTTCF